jgi:mannosyltransferase
MNQANDQTTFLTPARTALVLIAATLLGAELRLHLLSIRSLWIDEASSVHFATMPWLPFLRLLWSYQGNMTLYYVLLRAWIHLGDSEFTVRCLSVLFGVLTIPATYALGARLFDRATGLFAAVLLSVHSFHIAFSQEARGYSLLSLLLVLTTYALVEAMESNQNGSGQIESNQTQSSQTQSNQKLGDWIAFAVIAALCVYAHIFAVLALAAHALAIVFPRPYQVRARTIAVTASVFAFVSAPMGAFVLLRHSDQIDWVPRPTLAELRGFLDLLTSQGGILLVVVYLTLCALAFLHPAGVNRGKEAWSLRLLALWLVLPPSLTLAASLIKPVFLPRYMVMSVPALAILAARGVTNLFSVHAVKYWAAAPAVLLLVSLSGVGVHRYFENRKVDVLDWRSAVNYVLEHQQPGDGALIFIANANSYLYYAHRAESQHIVPAAPDVLYPPPVWKPVSREEVMQVSGARRRLWLILSDESDDPKALATIESTLAEGFQQQEKHVFAGEEPLTIALYTRPSGPR